jgi:hypothetical protein
LTDEELSKKLQWEMHDLYMGIGNKKQEMHVENLLGNHCNESIESVNQTREQYYKFFFRKKYIVKL